MSRVDEQLRHQLAKALREAIDRDELSQAELARTLGMSAKHVNQMVTGSGSATVMTWEFAAYALGYRWAVSLVREDEQ